MQRIYIEAEVIIASSYYGIQHAVYVPLALTGVEAADILGCKLTDSEEWKL